MALEAAARPDARDPGETLARVREMLPRLSARERQVVGLLLEGHKPIEIAALLGVTRQRVQQCRRRARRLFDE